MCPQMNVVCSLGLPLKPLQIFGHGPLNQTIFKPCAWRISCWNSEFRASPRRAMPLAASHQTSTFGREKNPEGSEPVCFIGFFRWPGQIHRLLRGNSGFYFCLKDGAQAKRMDACQLPKSSRPALVVPCGESHSCCGDAKAVRHLGISQDCAALASGARIRLERVEALALFWPRVFHHKLPLLTTMSSPPPKHCPL